MKHIGEKVRRVDVRGIISSRERNTLKGYMTRIYELLSSPTYRNLERYRPRGSNPRDFGGVGRGGYDGRLRHLSTVGLFISWSPYLQTSLSVPRRSIGGIGIGENKSTIERITINRIRDQKFTVSIDGYLGGVASGGRPFDGVVFLASDNKFFLKYKYDFSTSKKLIIDSSLQNITKDQIFDGLKIVAHGVFERLLHT